MEQTTSQALDLTTCEREPIHIPGAIQPFGALVVSRLQDFRITQASANVESLTGRRLEQVLGCHLGELIGQDDFRQLERELATGNLHALTPSTARLFEQGQPCNLFYHCEADLLITEFEVRQEDELQARGFWSQGELPFAEIQACSNTIALCQLLAREVRRLTGFDRVMAYRFDIDWHGEVIAEAKSEQYPKTYLDHHFPASDIPAQARRLFARNHLRMIPNVDYQAVPLVPPDNPVTGGPLDMSQAMLRNVSPIHLEYLQNMGVAASLTISLMDNDRLWGMITCHHATPRNVPHSIRLRCKILGELASYTVTAIERCARVAAEQERKALEAKIIGHLIAAPSLSLGLKAVCDYLLKYLRADGLILRQGGAELILGPPVAPDRIELLFDILDKAAGAQTLLCHHHLSALDTRLAALANVASGALFLRLSETDSLIALRREQVETRVWAGDPNKPTLTDPDVRIHPRKSFDHWREKVRQHSHRWSQLDRDCAVSLKRLLLERCEQILRARAEIALRESEMRFRATFEQAAVGVAHVALDGGWVRVNQKLCDILSYSAEELSAQTFQSITFKDDLARDLLQMEQLLRGEIATYNLEKRYIQKAGSLVWANLTVSLIRDDAGQPKHFIAIVEDISARKLAEERNCYLANHDTLTGLPNRAYFSDRIHETIAHAKREQGRFALMLLDLDRFKSVNDTLGHHVGDLLLKEVANRLLASVRETDVVARLGGDEFAIIQSHLATPDAPVLLADKIVQELDRPYWLDGTEIHSGTSVGITQYPGDAEDPVTLFKNADLALYRAKDRGRHNFHFFTEDLYSEAQHRKALEQGLRHALQERSLQLYYQPVYNLRTGLPFGAEALLSWQSKQMLLPASRFLKLAEETGLIQPLGEWALEEVFRQACAWQQMGQSGFQIGVNLSLKQLKSPNCVTFIRHLLTQYQVNPGCLEIDVSEGEMIQDQDQVLNILDELRELGLRICADDFGAGLSSLGRLGRLPVDSLKIDQGIVQRIPHSRHDAAIATAIINLAHELDLQVVAEGVESLEQLAFLEARGCHGGQGFIFSQPLSATDMTELLQSQQLVEA